jgi:hypothetical protein
LLEQTLNAKAAKLRQTFRPVSLHPNSKRL